MIALLRLLSLLPAFVLFFFPWVEVRCQKDPMFTQTGIQVIYGGATANPEFAKWIESDKEQTMEDRLGTGWLVGIALLSVCAAIVLAFLALRTQAVGHGVRAEGLAALALVALIIQLSIGFPAEEKIRNDTDPAKSGKPQDDLKAGISRTFVKSISTHVLPVYYVQLGLLGFPVLLLLNSSLSHLQRKDEDLSSGGS
ncbi:MAG: hypothetical protein ACKO2G_03795 [Verrucomicrobiales bacterium]